MSEITVADADRRRSNEQVLDVREDVEVSAGMIPGALHIPMGAVGDRLAELDRNRPVIVVCRSGNRSAHVAEALSRAGYRADTMAGGMVAWQRAGLPVG
ncbi:sulfurtransferase [Tersicoccus solisilvae]|uniref:Sulfurtransferase n=1 Tax=Tersicoccus solisilvae TaxID=1882339 RepID=A0ABQ1NL79_9MICC|nr:rhodanese-like domain-containing protein [Tersicoccus solisilvae]GGC79974.1 sulfurtransferase [Tersicoccus solisilvae]